MLEKEKEKRGWESLLQIAIKFNENDRDFGPRIK
jgi:hypothetical protein